MLKNVMTSVTLSAILAVAGLAQGTTVPAAAQPKVDTAVKEAKTVTEKAAKKKDPAVAAADKEAAKAAKAAAKNTPHTPMLSSGVTEADVTNAQAKGMVWVNTGTGVYHKSGEFYGKTKAGKFMTEDEAKKAGHHAAKTGGTGKKKKVS